MPASYSLAGVAALIGEPTRAAMLLGLMGGRALTATELARLAGLSAPATSLHLGKLLQGELITMRKVGRHRYYRIASPQVAHALEALSVIAAGAPPARALSPEHAALRALRSCYDHLAGAQAIELADALERAGVLLPESNDAAIGDDDGVEGDDRYRVTPDGVRWFRDTLAIDVAALAASRRSFARRCLDLTERRPHLAGALGAAVLDRFFERRWVARRPESRALRITSDGALAIASLGRSLARLRPAPASSA